MPITITMPALSPTMTEGKLSKWLVKEGDKVTSGTVIAEIETDKATMEVEAVDEGTMARILVAEGTEGVAVNAPIAILAAEGEDATAAAKDTAKPAPKPAAAPAPATPPQSDAKPAGQPAPAKAEAPPAKEGGRVFASPLARRIAADAGIDLALIYGSGPHGRIVKEDVEKAMAAGPAPKPVAQPEAAKAAPGPAAAPAPSGAVAVPPGDYEEVPLTSMRKTIARRLTEAKRDIPHIYLTVDVELDALLDLRKQLNARAGDAKMSVNDMLIKACAVALRKVPAANAIWGGDKVLLSKTFDVSVAVAIDQGLITPIVRNADRKGLSEIGTEMRALASRARAGKLKLEEFQGGAFSMSNLGMFGIKDFAAVINPPQAMILAVGMGEQRPVVKQGALAIATVMSVTLSCDHRIVDGALGAEWLKVFKGLVEDPLTMML